MTEQKSPTETTRQSLGTRELAWLVVAGLLFAIALFYAVIAPLVTMNPTGIPLGALCGLAAVGIVLVVLRSKRS